MNERIFEMAEQALEETHRTMGESCLQEAFDDFYTERFAELIVLECAVIVGSMEEPHQGIAELIKQHFGVE